MRESFIFYDSFLEAIDELDAKTKLEVYEAISHYALRGEEQNLTGISKAIFSLIKPQIDANNKRYENGKKGAGFGKLGGRPKKEKPQENPKETPNVNVNVNVNENVNENDNVFFLTEKKEEKEKTDPFLNPICDNFLKEYRKVFKQNGFLSYQQREKVLEINRTIPDLEEKLPEIFNTLKSLKFDNINFKPNLAWLLKNDNFYSVASGEFTNNAYDFEAMLEEIKAEKELENGFIS